jgi:hypothetical protein
VHGRTAKTGDQKKTRNHQQAINLAFAEFGIGWHRTAFSVSESFPGQRCNRNRSAIPGRVL